MISVGSFLKAQLGLRFLSYLNIMKETPDVQIDPKCESMNSKTRARSSNPASCVIALGCQYLFS
jgi:hypothetical protein